MYSEEKHADCLHFSAPFFRLKKGLFVKRFLCLLSLLALSPLGIAWGQLFAPNETGIALGQFHAIVRDMDSATKFFTTLGGTPIEIDGTKVIKFAGVLVFLTPGNPSGPSEGSVVDHIGFGVPDVVKKLAQMKAAGFKTKDPNPGGSPLNGLPTANTWSADDFMVELETVQVLTTPCKIVACIPYLAQWPPAQIASNHIHFHVPITEREQMQTWFGKTFGAPTGVLGDNLTADLPGARFTRWTKKVPAGEKTAPTKGRALDYIGFEVKGLEAFCKKLEAQGVKFDAPYSKTRHKSFASAMFTDPWGTSIELTEGLNRF